MEPWVLVLEVNHAMEPKIPTISRQVSPIANAVKMTFLDNIRPSLLWFEYGYHLPVTKK
jgi:hypothetical protein